MKNTTVPFMLFLTLTLPACPPAATRVERTAEPAVDAPASHPDGVAGHLIRLANDERRDRELDPLRSSPELDQIALSHARDMLQRGYFDHANPEARSPSDRVALHYRRFIGLVGENIWMGSGPPVSDTRQLAERIHGSWMRSRGHRENMLRPSYNLVGVSVYNEGPESRAVQLLAQALALLNEPLPESVGRRQRLNLWTHPFPEKAQPPERYDFVEVETGHREGDVERFFNGWGSAPGKRGRYHIRFYFREDTSFAIYPGPELKVE